MRADEQPAATRRRAQQHAADGRGGVGERINAELAALGRRAGHASLDLGVAGVKAAARNPREFIPGAMSGVLFGAADGASAEPAIGWPLVFTALAIAGYLLHRHNKHAAPGVLRRAYYAVSYLAMLTYLSAAATLSPADPLAVQILAAGGATASAAWWARHLRRRERVAALAEPEISDEERELARLRAEVHAWWVEKGAGDRGFAPGSSILGPVEVNEIAIRLDVQLNAERQTFDELVAPHPRKRMAATRGVARQLIHVGRWDDQREDRARVTLFRKYLVQENVPYPGPSIDTATGCTTVGRCADGSPALVRYWMPGSGTWHEIVAGGSGSGKSRYLDQALIAERHALDEQGRHLIVSWVCDPQEGQSLPDWQDQVDRFARNPVEALALVQRAYAEMLARNKFLASVKWVDEKGRERTGLKEYDPAKLAKLGIYLPILSLTLEEAPMLLQDARIKRMVEDMLKMARKCGIRIRLVTQIPSIAELGNSFTIRPLLAFMSVVCLRTTEQITGSAFPNLPGDPRQLEETFPDGSPTFGLGYILGAVKPALFRTFFLDDLVVYDWATEGDTAHLDESLYQAYMRSKQGDRSQGDDAEDLDADSDADDDTPPSRAPDTPAVGNARALIRRYLETHPGHVTSGILVADLGLNPSTVSQALKRGVAAGEFQRLKHGVYAAIGTDPGLWARGDARAA